MKTATILLIALLFISLFISVGAAFAAPVGGFGDYLHKYEKFTWYDPDDYQVRSLYAEEFPIGGCKAQLWNSQRQIIAIYEMTNLQVIQENYDHPYMKCWTALGVIDIFSTYKIPWNEWYMPMLRSPLDPYVPSTPYP